MNKEIFKNSKTSLQISSEIFEYTVGSSLTNNLLKTASISMEMAAAPAPKLVIASLYLVSIEAPMKLITTQPMKHWKQK